MKAIDFVVRDGAGALQRGVVPEDGNTTVALTSGQEVSFNLRQVDLIGQQRSGDDLIMTLADGRTITLENYFNDFGDANRLFISADGYLNEVAFVETADGELFAQYGPTEQWGKWSPSDDLIYLGRTDIANVGVAAGDEEVSMLGAALLGGGSLLGLGAGAAVVGGAALLGTGGGGEEEPTDPGSDPQPAAPTVDNVGTTTQVGGDDTDTHTFVVSGTGEPGDTVTIDAGGVTQITTIDAQGLWSVTFEGPNFPPDGTVDPVVVFTHSGGGETTLQGPTFIIDTVGPDVDFATGVESVGHTVNGTELSGGVTLTGTGEPGATLEIMVQGVTRTATVDVDGNWSATWQAGTLQEGEYSSEITIVATDSFGNTTTVTDVLVVDTVAEVTIATDTVEGDGTINAAEAADGVTLTGTAQAGSSVEVTFNGITRSATVDANGNWSVDYTAAEVPGGETSATITAVATDAAGNSATATGTIQIDTLNDLTIDTAGVEDDGIINFAEASDGVTLTGTTQPGSSVEVTFNGITRSATVDANGNWSAGFLAGEIPTGETTANVSATSTDAVGNVSTATGSIAVDTLVNALGFTSNAGGVDGTINAAEAGAGLVVTGITEPGSTVVVQLGNATTNAVVAADGTWTATFGGGSIPEGTYTTQMTATATDAAGNTRDVSQSVNVDTQASILTINGPIEGDDIVNGAEASDGVVLSGNADPGALVTVTMNGVSHQVVANAGGVWQAFYSASEITPGTYDADITATTTDAAGNTNTVTDTVHVDTRVDNLSVAADVIEGDNVISEAERADGVVLTGTTEPGSTILVTLGSATVQGIVDANGNWHAPFRADQIPQGEYVTDVSVTATDRAGNVATVTDTVRVDTLVNRLDIQDRVTSDDVISGTEAREGINLGGQVEPGSTVMVDFNGTVLAAVVDGGGNWSLDIPPSAIPGGTYDAAITVMATDSVGNTDTLSDTLRIDTDAPDGPVIASFTRDGDGIRGISTEQSDGELSVAQVNDDGSISNVAATQVEIDVLGETNFQFSSDVPDGSHLIVSSADAAGNTVGTYVVLDDESANSTVDLGNPSLGNYQIEAVDLQFAEEANLTITEAQLVALSDSTNTLTIHGGSDDNVTIAGATRTGSTTVDGQTYDVYALGTEGTVILDDDINVNTAIG